ncbi:MAG TPA: hypothetical protein VK681_39285 [Reyranella sp.]|nr:hypothetical protein [Reyranella sp.]
MAKAKRDGGLYYIDETAVDAEGKAIADAPAKGPDTDPSKQPGALGAPSYADQVGLAIAGALKSAAAGVTLVPAPPAPDAGSSGVSDAKKYPTLADLPAAVADLPTAADVRAMQAGDNRTGAVAIYEARLAELDQ